MMFMAIQGIGHWVEAGEDRALRIVVTGDDRVRVVTLRDETVPALGGDFASDLDWQVDQYTQETIGVTLAEEGWEVFSIAATEVTRQSGPAASPVYLVRR